MDQIPSTLNPRATVDAAGQRINALLFRALTRIDADLNPQPDLATSWKTSADGLVWRFPIQEGSKDHDGESIDAKKIAACLENYRQGKPTALVIGAFPSWQSTSVENNEVVIRLAKPDPYFARNATLLRYFRVANAATPCTEPGGEPVITSGMYKPLQWELAPEDGFTILPVMEPSRKAVRFSFVTDDNARALKLLSGEVDVLQSSISLTKIRWIQEKYRDRFQVLERSGVPVSYLAFNLKDPTLSKPKIRKAIALAIDREAVIRHKLFGFGSEAGSFLSPMLPEGESPVFKMDRAQSERLLDQAGFQRGRDGIRLRLVYKTTPVREGIETALIFKDQLARVGVELKLEVIEPAVFLASIRKGAFQLYSSRWIGVADGSILFNTLHSKQPLNRVRYENAQMDQLLEKAIAEADIGKRKEHLRKVQRLMLEDLPYFPLWYWSVAVVARKELTGLAASEISLSGALEPLTRLR